MMDKSASSWIMYLVYLNSCWTIGLGVKRDRQIYDQLDSFKEYVKDEIGYIKGDIRILFGSLDNLTAASNTVRNIPNDDGVIKDSIGNGSAIIGNQEEWTQVRALLKDPYGCGALMKAFQAEKLENRRIKERLVSIEERIADIYQDVPKNIPVLSKESSSFRDDAEPLTTEPLKVETTSRAFKHTDCKTVSDDGVYSIFVESMEATVSVFCDQTIDGGGWIVFMRRRDGSQNFRRSWLDYKNGFGETDGEFWAGNELLYQLTANNSMQLRIDMTDFDGNKAFAQYDLFQIGSEEDKYRLHVSGYSGDAGDSLINPSSTSHVHNGMAFTTFDSDNDKSRDNCARVAGGWWFNRCFAASLSAVYSTKMGIWYHGIIWHSWKGWREPLKFVEMKIR